MTPEELQLACEAAEAAFKAGRSSFREVEIEFVTESGGKTATVRCALNDVTGRVHIKGAFVR